METQDICFDTSYSHYAQAGKGELKVVVLHGWGASLKQWEWLLPIVADAGHTAYALDLLGHGQAPRLARNHTIKDYLDHLRQWMKVLNIQQPILLGHSMGGYLGLEYALEHPGAVRGLILVDPLYSHYQLDTYRQFARRLLSEPQMLTVGEFLFRHTPAWLIEASHSWNRNDFAGVPTSLRRQVALDYKRADPRIVHTLPTLGDLRPHLGHVTIPALVVWGCRDQLLPHDSFETLVDLLPMAWGHCFTDIGHNPHLNRAPDFIKLILAFLHQVKVGSWGLGTAAGETNQIWTSITGITTSSR